MSEPHIRLELKHARVCLAAMNEEDIGRREYWAAQRALDRAIAPHDRMGISARSEPSLPQKFRKPSPLDRERKRNEKQAREARRTMDVYDQVRHRAGGMCECGCLRPFRDGPLFDSLPEMDDFFGGAKHLDARKCWMIRADCHREKTANNPSREKWLRKFISHCRRYGFTREAYRAQAKLDSRADIARAGEEVRRGT